MKKIALIVGLLIITTGCTNEKKEENHSQTSKTSSLTSSTSEVSTTAITSSPIEAKSTPKELLGIWQQIDDPSQTIEFTETTANGIEFTDFSNYNGYYTFNNAVDGVPLTVRVTDNEQYGEVLEVVSNEDSSSILYKKL
jgi:PBP1b-binding outer membrane lipoprotein LpoB